MLDYSNDKKSDEEIIGYPIGVLAALGVIAFKLDKNVYEKKFLKKKKRNH